jgi:EpsI family protein
MNKNLPLYLIVGAAAVLMLSAGYVQGVWTERWGEFPELKVFSEQLTAVPKQIGEWEGTDGEEMDERTKEAAGAEGELMRTYRNANGQEVRVSLVCGRLQNMTDHTPDRCYPAAGFDMQGEPQRVVFETPSGDAEFMAASFMKSEPSGTQAVRGYWSYSGDGQWTAPDNAKTSLASQKNACYKLYVFAPLSTARGEAPADTTYCEDFVRVFIPMLNEALRPAFEKVGRVEASAAAAAQPATEKPAAESAEKRAA